MSSTADLLDSRGRRRGLPDPVQVVRCAIVLGDGSPRSVASEDNVLLRQRAEEPGDGRVLVVDGGGSMACALLGDNIASLALASGWAGIVLNGCVRDSVALDELGLGIKAVGAIRGRAARKAPVRRCAGRLRRRAVRTWRRAYADEDGVVVLPRCERPRTGPACRGGRRSGVRCSRASRASCRV